MRSPVTLTRVVVALLPLLSLPNASHAVSVGEIDSFATNLEGWGQGQASTAVTRVLSGGPTGDPYLRIVADSTASQGRLVVFNQTAAWTGDYLAAGVTSVTMDLNNLGATDLSLRLVLGTSPAPMLGGSWLASSAPINLPSGSGWMSVDFPLASAAMTLVDGSDPYAAVMSNVATLRLLHATVPSSVGNLVTATLGVDNITAVGTAPIPGDFNGNQIVDGADLAEWRAEFGSSGADADADGDSDGSDFLIWQRQLTAPPAAAVPEPHAALGMLVLLAIAAPGRIRGRARLLPSRGPIEDGSAGASPSRDGRFCYRLFVRVSVSCSGS
jgi:hypothetical protein